MKYKLACSIFCLLVLSNCGFKLAQNTYDFSIVDINTSGDKNISYLLKNKLNFGSKEKANQLEIEIFSKKIKTIKEKNITNQITKYEVKIVSRIEYKTLPNGDLNNFTISKFGDFSVTSEHLNTLNNEKKLIEVLINVIAEEILLNLSIKLNDS
tara:strand:- start:574 stop:1035 length:462 start_codon:yes stop_codon:yes gene_type:complete